MAIFLLPFPNKTSFPVLLAKTVVLPFPSHPTGKQGVFASPAYPLSSHCWSIVVYLWRPPGISSATYFAVAGDTQRQEFFNNFKTNFRAYIYIYIPGGMEARRATLANMGLRNEASVAFHILQENVWESNLVSDIAKVDYLADNEGQTNLHPLEGLPPFVDDVYVYGPLAVEDVVVVHGRPSCTTGENGTAKRLVAKLAGLAWEVWRQKLHVSIVHTVGRASSGKISETLEQIGQSGLGQLAATQWHRIQPEATIAAYFVAKCDVSELPMQDLQKGLQGFCRHLLSIGSGLYQIVYTRDFAGTLDRPALVAHLVEQGFRQQGDQPTQNDSGCILDNTTSVGHHVCTFVQTKNDRTIATKFYNKIVSQIEAGDVRKGFEGHAAHLLESTNQHLRRTLAHLEVLAKGCTRIEVPVYGCGSEELSERAAEEFLGEALALSVPCQVAACAQSISSVSGAGERFATELVSKGLLASWWSCQPLPRPRHCRIWLQESGPSAR